MPKDYVFKAENEVANAVFNVVRDSSNPYQVTELDAIYNSATSSQFNFANIFQYTLKNQSGEQLTAFRWACRLGQTNAMAWLVNKGARISAEEGKVELDAALNNYLARDDRSDSRSRVSKDGARQVVTYLVQQKILVDSAAINMVLKALNSLYTSESYLKAQYFQLFTLMFNAPNVNRSQVALAEIVKLLTDERLASYQEEIREIIKRVPRGTVDDNLSDQNGDTALMHAVRAQDKGLVEALLIRDARVDVVSSTWNKYTALGLAYESGNKDIVSLLLKKTQDYKRAWFLAARYNDVEALQFIRSKNVVNVDERDENGYTALMLAAKNKHKEAVNFLIKHKANLNTVRTESDGKEGACTALGLAIQEGADDIVKSLLEQGADPNLVSNDATPLQWAANNEKGREDSVPLLQLLTQHGAKLHLRAGVQNSLKGSIIRIGSLIGSHEVLTLAAISKGKEAAVAYLLPFYMDLKYPGDKRQVLKEALEKVHNNSYRYNDDHYIIIILILACAVLQPEDYSHLLQHVDQPAEQNSERFATIKLLLKKISSARYTELFNHALSMRNPGLARVMMEAGHVSLDVKDRHGATALHRAAEMGNNELLEKLIAAGLDVNAVDNKGRTVLMAAAAADSLATVKLLLNRGARLKDRDLQGNTAYHHAVGETRSYLRSLVYRSWIKFAWVSVALAGSAIGLMGIAALAGIPEVAALLTGLSLLVSVSTPFIIGAALIGGTGLALLGASMWWSTGHSTSLQTQLASPAQESSTPAGILRRLLGTKGVEVVDRKDERDSTVLVLKLNQGVFKEALPAKAAADLVPPPAPPQLKA